MMRNLSGIAAAAAFAAMCSHAENPNRIRSLADDFVVVCKSPDPQRIYCFTPGICRLPSGRLVATCDLGGPDSGICISVYPVGCYELSSDSSDWTADNLTWSEEDAAYLATDATQTSCFARLRYVWDW